MSSGADLFLTVIDEVAAVVPDTVVVVGADDGPLPTAIRRSLQAKVERLLRRPLVAAVVRAAPKAEAVVDDVPAFFRLAKAATQDAAPTAGVASALTSWLEAEDGTWTIRIEIDYADLWRGSEKEVLETVKATVEGAVTFLTEEQRVLLTRSPREFLALEPRPESAELISYRSQVIGGSERVLELTVAAPPASPEAIVSIAVVPNLIPLERQLSALHTLCRSPDNGPLAPLRALVGLCDVTATGEEALVVPWQPPPGTRLDASQSDCVRQAMETPHFAVIKGPPGSGKTTVITSIIRQVLDRGGRVLVVSPTHVAVDNVVEKLVAGVGARDTLEPATLPVRYAARSRSLLPGAADYWVGAKKQSRAATIAVRLEKVLSRQSAVARAAFRRVDPTASGQAALTGAVASVQRVICGTPIGILSYEPVKNALPAAFDLLVVDEVSKMTLPEFLAVAVKAKRWVLVGDPDQLPPFSHAEENGTTLNDVLSPELELVLSVGTLLGAPHPSLRAELRILVVASDPDLVATAIRAHLSEVGLNEGPPVVVYGDGAPGGVVVCRLDEMDEAAQAMSSARRGDLSRTAAYKGSLDILVERGLRPTRPAFASGTRLVEARLRAPAVIFETAFLVYHCQPWAARANHRLRSVGFRNGISKSLPSAAALRALNPDLSEDDAWIHRVMLTDEIAARFAVNTVSVYDWLAGIPTGHFDTAPLEDLAKVAEPLAALRESVQPYVGTLKKQYRMHRSLSEVPRELFYFNEALFDGNTDGPGSCRVVLVQVEPKGQQRESNPAEADAIRGVLEQLKAGAPGGGPGPTILVITPYREQERLLSERVERMRASGGLDGLEVEVCTLDRCQGREADYVFVSLVRGEATPFLDAPKRWNVALTRAKEGLFLVGDVNKYLLEAQRARSEAVRDREGRPRMSLLARILEAYDLQIHGRSRPGAGRRSR